MGVTSQKLRASARGQTCTIQIPGVCNHNPETTVLAHAPSEFKGTATKSHDFHGCFACYACHDTLDQHRLERWEECFYWLRGIQRTQAYWYEKGLMVIPVDTPRPKQSSKILPRRHPLTGAVIS